mmetsp:Transcript_36974/g.82195  ORF Transcript_36974/g.82195 Transcript_36974/m.82195 type:complete len:237 (+) Transcript_36974:86-796(+)|eukprot:CAMPEP_0202890036 /NCGR_PEP_ID=MMETSP1392-20130828/558_1 /ASSEMBLY_ACC=CAM_ASM_000868 /TAXON_ID=225041 /ORGANISM="Chlamydomonas chlamydogama, Strain SAG 11-48b" /LENGTH=236 /DNA_ID=CAMNT_0049573515 /DNA_START=59 /DNA_END=769 /DNA_ORIENTATION=+
MELRAWLALVVVALIAAPGYATASTIKGSRALQITKPGRRLKADAYVTQEQLDRAVATVKEEAVNAVVTTLLESRDIISKLGQVLIEPIGEALKPDFIDALLGTPLSSFFNGPIFTSGNSDTGEFESNANCWSKNDCTLTKPIVTPDTKDKLTKNNAICALSHKYFQNVQTLYEVGAEQGDSNADSINGGSCKVQLNDGNWVLEVRRLNQQSVVRCSAVCWSWAQAGLLDQFGRRK